MPATARYVERWQILWRALTASVDFTADEALLATLVASYGEPQRHYHTMQHLDECLAQFDGVRALAGRPAEVECALWFHDAVYDVRAHDNEQRSADWARSALLAAGVADEAAGRVHALILATRHDALPATADENVLIDVDLSILAAPGERFAQYETQVRQEYAWVPEAVYRSKRAEILRRFLDRDWIYGTAPFRLHAEANARRNLRASIAVLSA